MRILAIEGALARCSAAVLVDGALVATALAEASRGQPALLPPMVRDVLAQAGLDSLARIGGAMPGRPRRDASVLDAVAVGIGPGGFTGLRAAIALAQGLAQGAGLPLVGITTGEALLAALPAALRAGRATWAAVDNRRGRVVLEVFAPGADRPDAPQVAALDALPHADGPVLVLGDAAEVVAAALCARGDRAQAHAGLPNAADLARLAAAWLRAGVPLRAAVPLYAEPPAVTAPAPPVRA
jgi:tRNA threonylcarbamoyladenosine biosynthesis protein TsaB